MNRFLGILTVFAVTFLSLFVAILMDWTANNVQILSIGFILVLSAVIGLNATRLILWNKIHKVIDLSRSYALTAIFFPLIAFTAFIQGEEILLRQWIGVLIICLGVFWISAFTRDTADSKDQSPEKGDVS